VGKYHRNYIILKDYIKVISISEVVITVMYNNNKDTMSIFLAYVPGFVNELCRVRLLASGYSC
jgi:hypothetical protein